MSSQEVNKSQKGTFNAEDISLFCTQLTLTLKAGISLYDGVCAINENIKNPKAHKILKNMEADLEFSSSNQEKLYKIIKYQNVSTVEQPEETQNLWPEPGAAAE